LLLRSQLLRATGGTPPGILLALSYTTFLGYMSLALAPMWVGALVNTQGSANSAGLIASIQFVSFGIASLGAAVLITRIDARCLVFLGLLISGCGDLASFQGHDFLSMVLSRAAGGFGEGVVLAAVSASTAATANPQRSFSAIVFLLSVFIPMCFALTSATEPLGVRGIFILMMGAKVVGMSLVGLLPAHVNPAGAGNVNRVRSLALSVAVIPSLLAYSLYWMAELAIWAFMKQIGLSKQLSTNSVADILAIAALFAPLGALGAGWLGTRRGLWLPLIAGLVIAALSAVLFVLPFAAVGFTAGNILFNVVLQLCLVYFLSLLTAQDPTGRAVAAAPAFASLGLTVGPLAGGASIAHFGLPSASIVSMALFLAAAALIAASMKRRPGSVEMPAPEATPLVGAHHG
jgi:predicted MFS family arabinose efflux permease